MTSTTVGASLRPDSASRAPISRCGSGTTPQHREHRGRVGRRGDRAEQHAPAPRAGRAGSATPTRHDRHRDRHPERGQRQPEPHRRTAPRASSVVRPPSARISASAAKPSAWASSAFSNADPEHRLAEQHAHQQVDQQAGQPRPRREPHGQDRQEGDRRPHQHERVELVDVEGHGLLRGGGMWPVEGRVYRSGTCQTAAHEQVRRRGPGQRAAVPRDGPAGGGGRAAAHPRGPGQPGGRASR